MAYSCCGQLDSRWRERILDGGFRYSNGKFELRMEKSSSERKSLVMRCCSGHGNGNRNENEKYLVKMMREAEPYFKAHRGSTFVVILSGEVVYAPCYFTEILEVIIYIYIYICTYT